MPRPKGRVQDSLMREGLDNPLTRGDLKRNNQTTRTPANTDHQIGRYTCAVPLCFCFYLRRLWFDVIVT